MSMYIWQKQRAPRSMESWQYIFNASAAIKGTHSTLSMRISSLRTNSLQILTQSFFQGFLVCECPVKLWMKIGYEDCDWISIERHAVFLSQFASWPFPMELHLPCRDPLDNLMSQCNFQGIVFDSAEENMEQ
jgi:hypothetical protein